MNLAASFVFILAPTHFRTSSLSKFYRAYLLPGPFFSDKSIVNNYRFSVRWKVNGVWSDPVNPAMDHFNEYHKTLWPAYLYQSRFERSLYQGAFFKTRDSVHQKEASEFRPLIEYLKTKHVGNGDSLKIVFTRKAARNFEVKLDTLLVIVE